MQTQTESKSAKRNQMANGKKSKNKKEENNKDKSESQSEDATEQLQRFLADSFVLYMKTYAVHWNYQGAKFFAVHKITEQQYGELYQSIDTLAERIRAKRDEAPFSLASMLENADLDELSHDGGKSDRSVRNLVDSHMAMAQLAKKTIEDLDDEDPFTADLLTARIGAHEKAAWMLRSLLA